MSLLERKPFGGIEQQRSELPFPIEEKNYEYYQAIDSRAKNFQEINNEDLTSSEITIKAPCTAEMIVRMREKLISILPENTFSDEDIKNLRSLIGEIVLDTKHSQDKGQNFENPYFIVKISGLSCRELFSFEVINQDRTNINEWQIISKAADIVEQYGRPGKGTHAGTNLKKGIVDDLDGYAEYTSVKGKDGKKEFTSFRFEMSGKLRLGSFYEWLKPQKDEWGKIDEDDYDLDRIEELYYNFLIENGIGAGKTLDMIEEFRKIWTIKKEFSYLLIKKVSQRVQKTDESIYHLEKKFKDIYGKPPVPQPQPSREQKIRKRPPITIER